MLVIYMNEYLGGIKFHNLLLINQVLYNCYLYHYKNQNKYLGVKKNIPQFIFINQVLYACYQYYNKIQNKYLGGKNYFTY